jgi:hypothetical protein
MLFIASKTEQNKKKKKEKKKKKKKKKKKREKFEILHSNDFRSRREKGEMSLTTSVVAFMDSESRMLDHGIFVRETRSRLSERCHSNRDAIAPHCLEAECSGRTFTERNVQTHAKPRRTPRQTAQLVSIKTRPSTF